MQADEAADAAAKASLESIFIAPGNPLGTTVVEAKVMRHVPENMHNTDVGFVFVYSRSFA